MSKKANVAQESRSETPVTPTSSTGSVHEDRQLLFSATSTTKSRLERLTSVEAPASKVPTLSGAVSRSGYALAETERVTYYIWFLTGMISISGLLFGLDTGIISGILVSLGDDLGHELSNSNKELITSMTTALAFVGGIAAGITSDKLGRKSLLLVADAFFIAGAIVQAVAHNVATMAAGRGILGVGVGVASCVCPLILTELAPTHLRGRLVTINVIMITLGQVIAYAIGAAFEQTGGGWRWMAGLCAIPAGIQIVALVFLPESPRQLIVHGKLKTAKAALKKIYPYETDEEIDGKIAFLQQEAALHSQILASEPVKKRFKDMLLIGCNRRALIIAGGLQLLQQLSGFNTLMYYSATLFASIGFNNPTAVGLIVSGTNFLGTLIALKYIDIIGRRRILLWSVPGMVIGLVLAAVSFHFLTLSTGGNLVPGTAYPSKWSGLVLFSMVFYVLSYALGIGNIPWQQGELFPISYRGIGTSIATGCNWSSNLVIGSTYLSLMDAITPSGAFGFYGGICFVGFIFVVFCYPNTAGLSIEETMTIFKTDFGIKAADRMRAEKLAAASE